MILKKNPTRVANGDNITIIDKWKIQQEMTNEKSKDVDNSESPTGVDIRGSPNSLKVIR